jgi:hypothetical protein
MSLALELVSLVSRRSIADFAVASICRLVMDGEFVWTGVGSAFKTDRQNSWLMRLNTLNAVG